MMDADYTDDLALFENSLAESLLYSPEQAVRGIGLYMNVIK